MAAKSDDAVDEGDDFTNTLGGPVSPVAGDDARSAVVVAACTDGASSRHRTT
ncbi:MAG: hypothetical protein HZA46_09225 [Planctomycetales bacterium]|nr:hypothetical protein [Planctomycetales bacterium]